MSEINEHFMLARNVHLEQQAIETIISLFASEDINNKSEAERMALILETISAACDVVPRKENDEDSKKLQEFNSALEHYVKQFRGEEAVTIKNVGKDLNSCITTLNKIRLLLKNEVDGEWKANRMSFFIDGLKKAGEKHVKKVRVRLWGLSLLFCGCLYALLGLAYTAFSDKPFSLVPLFSLLIIGGAEYSYSML